MRFPRTASALAVIATFAFGAGAAQAANTSKDPTVHRRHASGSHHGHGAVRYANGRAHGGASNSSGFVDLAQDSQSGAGFYPLPPQYRAAARQARAIQYARDRNAIDTAIASEAIPYDFEYGYYLGNGHGVFNPVDCVGTPFFAGYYN